MTDPIRWRDDPNAPDGLQSLMQAAEADGPSTAELEALWSGLPLSGGPVPVDLANAGAASAGATVAAKWVVGGRRVVESAPYVRMLTSYRRST